jgi:hypothetical protein
VQVTDTSLSAVQFFRQSGETTSQWLRGPEP